MALAKVRQTSCVCLRLHRPVVEGDAGRYRHPNGDPLPRGITIGPTHYPTKEAVRNICRSIVQRYGIDGDVTGPDDDAFLRHLLECHPEYDLKRGDGIAHLRISPTPITDAEASGSLWCGSTARWPTSRGTPA
ncbi:DUF3223 domain-containing protein [Streptomyces sp. NPDC048252]|uniref:DUF3223 domain-containing protein n=1 Tax=Streptomyces sp. NPDC048252 TaxID=3154612 RepID=UPI003423A7B0